ncbi:MAG: hypothetical protein M4D80_37450 [Myxococcota bacterium]|nr:hypothetical protein [Deltaproteobacteria bacterium]MDQ3340879.1 hypothetical protein [Myxococcota bacterium]
MGRFALVVMVLAFGCSKGGGARGAAGTERGDCRTGDNKCDQGLLCLSNLCVRPPAADCKMVSETLASLDLGNYAEPEERAPVVAKYKASCEKTYVSKEEGECLDKARDKWTAGQCAPRLFPEMTAKGTDCKQVSTKIESAMKQMQGMENPQMAQYLETMVRVVGQSCVEDAWPDTVKQCILMQSGGADAMQVCNQQFPPALQSKLQERLQTAMREQMK